MFSTTTNQWHVFHTQSIYASFLLLPLDCLIRNINDLSYLNLIVNIRTMPHRYWFNWLIEHGLTSPPTQYRLPLAIGDAWSNCQKSIDMIVHNFNALTVGRWTASMSTVQPVNNEAKRYTSEKPFTLRSLVNKPIWYGTGPILTNTRLTCKLAN